MNKHASALDFLLGEWDVEMLVLPEGVDVGRRARSRVSRILDGAALFDEWLHFDERGRVNFSGATFRTYLPEKDEWYVLWMMGGVEGYSELHARILDGEIRTEGRGRDPGGALEERGRYFDISADVYSFTLDRTYGGGRTWISPFVAFRAARRKGPG